MQLGSSDKLTVGVSVHFPFRSSTTDASLPAQEGLIIRQFGTAGALGAHAQRVSMRAPLISACQEIDGAAALPTATVPWGTTECVQTAPTLDQN